MQRARIAGAVVVAGLAALGVWAFSVTAPGRSDAPAVAGPRRLRPQGGVYRQPARRLESLNPFTTQDQIVLRSVLRYTHDGLLELDPDTAAVRGALATSWRPLEDGGRWQAELRAGVRFADGTECTARDVVFTVAAARSGAPLGRLHRAIELLASVEALGDRTVAITLAEDTAMALEIALTELPVLSAGWWTDEVARRAAALGEPVPELGSEAFGALLARIDEPGPGTGPYRLPRDGDGRPDWRPGERLALVRNEESWRRAAEPASWNLAALQLRVLVDSAAQLAALRRGEIDWMLAPDPGRFLERHPDLAADFRPMVIDSVHGGTFVVLWNTERPGLDDATVRRALAHLFDREAIARELLAGNAHPARSWFRPGTPAHPDDLPPMPFDPGRARELLREAGRVPEGGTALRVRLLHAADEPFHRQVFELARPAFARAGVVLEPEALASPVLLERVFRREFDAALVLVSSDPWQDPYRYFHSSQVAGGRNWMGWRDPELDALLEAARAEHDRHRRARLLRRIAHRLAVTQPATPLVHPMAGIVLHRRFRDVEPGPLGLVPKDWWVPPEMQRD